MHVYSRFRPPTEAVQVRMDYVEGNAAWEARQRWTEEPYGGKKVLFEARISGGLSKRVMLLRIDPGMNTGTKDLDANGLGGHPGTVLEEVTVLRCQPEGLRYRSRARHGGAAEPMFFDQSESFTAVGADGKGYWHTIENISGREPAILLVTIIRREGPRGLLRK